MIFRYDLQSFQYFFPSVGNYVMLRNIKLMLLNKYQMLKYRYNRKYIERKYIIYLFRRDSIFVFIKLIPKF